MKRYPLKEIKELQNMTVRVNRSNIMKDSKIKNYSQFQILNITLENTLNGEKTFQNGLEKILNIRKSTLSGILDTMEKNSIIIRTVDVESKLNIIELSEETLKYHVNIIKKITLLEEKLVDGISDDDLDIFFKVIDQMKENIRKEDFYDKDV